MHARDIAAEVSMPRVLRELGFAVSERTHRSACILHGGKNPQAFSWRDDGRWFCFNCGRGGDKLALIREVHRCDFKTALNVLASWAGVNLDDSEKFKRELAHSRRERQHREIEQAKMRAVERQALLQARAEVLELEQLRRIAGSRLADLTIGWEIERFDGEADLAWSALEFVAKEMPRAAAAYAVIAFADAKTRLRFAEHPEQRAELVNSCLAGAVRDDKNRPVHVVL